MPRQFVIADDHALFRAGLRLLLTDAVLAEAYGVVAVRGERDGEPFVLPWRAASPGDGG